MFKRLFLFFSGLFLFTCPDSSAQVYWGSSSCYGLRKMVPSYAGSAIQVRRNCDNATRDIGFTSCGVLDTTTMKNFLVIANPIGNLSTASVACYSVRKIVCSYAGNAFQVRRSSDNATQDIGFTSDSDLDTTALKTFIGNNSGFVTIWYDQSGNARNASQATTTKQPRIVNAGVIDRVNNKPAFRFLGQGYALFTAGFSAYSAACTFNFVAQVNTNMTYNDAVNKCNTNFPKPFDFYNNTLLTGNAGSYTNANGTQTFNAAKGYSIWTHTAVSGGGNMNTYCNGSNTLTTAVPAADYGDGAGDPLYIGHRVDGFVGLGMDGWISEVATFGAVLSANDRQFLEWDQSQYYSIAGPAITASAPHGFVTIWYDQSGNGRNLAPSAATNQPKIVTTGVINRQNTKPAVVFDGTNDFFTHNSFPTAGYTGYTANVMAKWTTVGATTATIQALLDNNNSVGVGFIIQDRPDQVNKPLSFSAPTVAVGAVDAITTGNSSFHTLTSINNGVSDFLHREGTQVGVVANAGAYNFQTRFVMGAWWNAGTQARFLNGSIIEATTFQSALSKTRRTLLETSQGAYYALAVTNSKYTPLSASTYTLYVNGVGRESATDSICDTRSSAGMGFIVGTAGTDYLKDNGDYMCAGIDCPITPSVSVANLPATVTARWLNDWYIYKTDVNANSGNIKIYFDFSEYGVPGTPGLAANYVLLTRASTAANFTIVAGTATSISGDKVIFTVDASNITNGLYTIGTKNIPASTLPITLLEFNAQVCDKNVCVNWSTANETNNDYFTVERSADAQHFETVGILNGAGTSNSQLNYSLIDHSPYPGLSYYRLKQTDNNTNSTYSQTVPVKFTAAGSISIYPNPNNGTMHVNYNLEKGETGELLIFDLNGKQVYSFLLKEDQKSVTLDKLQLDEGVYYYKYGINGNLLYADKIVIIR